MKMSKGKRKGFTLVELVIVIAVIAVLSAILIPTFATVIDNANKAKDDANAKAMTTELMLNATMDGLSGYSAQEARALIFQFSEATTDVKSKDNSYWYNTATNQVEVHNTKEMLLGTGSEGAASVMAKTLAYSSTRTLSASVQSTVFSLSVNSDYVYIAGNEALSAAVDILGNLTTYARLKDPNDVAGQMNALYQEALGKLDSLSSELKTAVTNALAKFDPSKCLYFDNVGIYTSAADNSAAFTNYVVTNGTTRIAGLVNKDKDDESKVVYIHPSVELVFPAGCKVNGNSFKGLDVQGGGTVTVTVPAANSATSAVIKQSVSDLIQYSQEQSSVTEANVTQALQEAYDLTASDALTGVDLSDAASVLVKVEEAVSQQVFSVSLNSNFNVVTDASNQVTYKELTFDFGYIQSELRALVGNRDQFFRSTNNSVTAGSGSLADSGFVQSQGTLAYVTLDLSKTGAELVEAYGITDTATASSEYLIPTLDLEVSKIFAALNEMGLKPDSIGENDRIRLTYENYANYGVISGVCVFHNENTVVSYRIKPVMYIKRVSVSRVTMDAVLGLNNTYVVGVPDVSSSVNLSSLTVWAKLKEQSELVQLTQITAKGSAHTGKYYYNKADSTETATIEEIIIKDKNGAEVFRQFINTKSSAADGGDQTQE